MIIHLEFEPRDLWVGVYWTKRRKHLHVFICPLPTLVIHLTGSRRRTKETP